MIMPGEFEPHEATWLVWPRNRLTFGEGIEKVQETYLQLIKEISKSERVELLVNDNEEIDRIKSMTGRGRVNFNIIKSCDVWVRDYGPIFVLSKKEVLAVKWKFNAWGAKYTDLLDDDRTGLEIAKKSGKRIIRPNLVLEGGAIDVNGKGICLSTKSCLLDRKRNPAINEAKLLRYLRRYLGIRKVIWLESKIAGDDTDGHVDNVARFVNTNTVVTIHSKERGWDFAKRNLEKLRKFKIGEEGRLDVYTLPVPDERPSLPLSYANFYFTNKQIIMPVFGKKNDDTALSLLESVTGRKVIPIECSYLLNGFGGIHCITQQQPCFVNKEHT